MAASRVKSVSFRDDEKELLDHAEKQKNFSEYVKDFIRIDILNGDILFSEGQKNLIIDMIKKYAPTVKDEDIKKEFDKEKVDALGQFENM